MLTNFHLAMGTVVIAQNALIKDSPVGKLIDTVIDSKTGNIEALWVSTGDGMRLLLIRDILFWKTSEIVISDENDLVIPEELPKLNNILAKEVPIIGSRAYGTFTKKAIGKVANFAFDTISPCILSLQIKTGWWVFGGMRVIPRSKIVKITEEAIHVNDEGIKVKTEKKKPVDEGAVIDQP